MPREDPAALVKLSQAIGRQHTKPGVNSPITDNVVKMMDYTQRATLTADLQDQIDALTAELQEKTGQRDQLLGISEGQNAQSKGTTLFETLQIRDLLLAANRGNEEALEPWGFSVVIGTATSPSRKPKPTA